MHAMQSTGLSTISAGWTLSLVHQRSVPAKNEIPQDVCPAPTLVGAHLTR